MPPSPPASRRSTTTRHSRRRWLLALAALVCLLVYLRVTHRPPQRDLPITYTAHARERMEERRITEENVEHAVRHGSWRPGRAAGRFEATHHVSGPHAVPRRIQVVFSIEQGHIVVITVMASPQRHPGRRGPRLPAS